jgi:hypothetical protein
MHFSDWEEKNLPLVFFFVDFLLPIFPPLAAIVVRNGRLSDCDSANLLLKDGFQVKDEHY